MTIKKTKLSLTVSADLLELVDRDVRKLKGTRSSVIELWLRRAAIASTRKSIEDATAAYYLSLQVTEEDENLSRALSKAAKRVAYDATPAPRRVAS
jgi:metal-responsive CopG/Arc/MetJ family transcriptional regulator